MARKALIAKAKKKPKFQTRVIRRCWRCGRKITAKGWSDPRSHSPVCPEQIMIEAKK